MSEISDEKLAFAARSGDKAAEEQLLQRYKNSVRGAARSSFLEGGETEDLVQEGMIGLYNAITDFREGGMSFKNFAYLCINRRIMSAVKSASRKKHIPLNDYVPLFDADGQGLLSPYDPESAVISGEEKEEFLALLRRELSPAEYKSLSLYMEGLTIAEIAAKEGKSEKSCENAVQRAKRKIANVLQKQ